MLYKFTKSFVMRDYDIEFNDDASVLYENKDLAPEEEIYINTDRIYYVQKVVYEKKSRFNSFAYTFYLVVANEDFIVQEEDFKNLLEIMNNK